MSVTRFVLTVMGAAALASLLTNLTASLALVAITHASIDSLVASFFGLFIGAYVFSIIIGLTIGPLWHVIARVQRWNRGRDYWMPGAVCGAIVAMGIVLPFGTLGQPSLGALALALTLAGYGSLLGGLTGYFAWRIRRPDRDSAANPPTSPA